MKKAAVLISILLASAFMFSCHSTITKVRSSLVTVKVSSRTAMLDIRPATPVEKMKRFLARTFSAPVADAAIPAVVQDLRLTVSASDMTTITATVNVAGLSSADFIVEVPNGKQRHFVVEGLDTGGAVKYQGDAYSDLTGDPVLLTITMASSSDVIPPVFGGVTSVAIASSTSITLSWSPATDNVTSSANMVYLIYASTTPGGENFSGPDYSTPAGATTYTAAGLTPGTTYYFVVRAKDEAGNIDGNTVEKSTTLPDTIPPTFAGLESATVLSSTSVQLSWSPATDNVTAQANIVYLIYQATFASGESYTTPTYTTTAGATSYTVTGLTPGTTYYFVAQAKDEAGNIDSNTIERSNSTPDTTPPTFAGLSLISNVTTTSMLLTWLPATDDVTPQTNIKYLIYQATSPNGEVYTAPTYSTTGATSYLVNGLNLTPGGAYYFVVRAQDAAGNFDGNKVEMSGYYPGTYVDVNTGLDQTGCGTPAQPCQTITFVLSQPTFTDNTKIFVAPGIYSSASVTTPETFPLMLKTGTALLCYGIGFSTVIDDSAGLSTTGSIIINDTTALGGTLIDGCKVNTIIYSNTAGAIDDSGLAMIVNNCSVNGSGSVRTGIQLSANSTVMNSIVTGFPGSDGGGAGIRIAQNALVSGNTLIGNWDGVYISSGNPIILSNTFTANFNGLNIADGSPTINNNIIANNTNSGIATSGTPSTSPIIVTNDISSNAYGIQTISQGTWTISGNTINNNAYTGIWIDNTYSLSFVYGTISGNIISNSSSTTTAYGIQIRPTYDVIMSVTGNTINGNGIGIDVSTISSTVTLPKINNNNLFCNNAVDLNTSTVSPLNAQSNAWDYAPPNVQSPLIAPCGPGQDICYSGTVPDYSLFTQVPSPCP